eukprot:9476314-Pyramimonas_sp.AAC.1
MLVRVDRDVLVELLCLGLDAVLPRVQRQAPPVGPSSACPARRGPVPPLHAHRLRWPEVEVEGSREAAGESLLKPTSARAVS